jgi:hypothetical protein
MKLPRGILAIAVGVALCFLLFAAPGAAAFSILEHAYWSEWVPFPEHPLAYAGAVLGICAVYCSVAGFVTGVIARASPVRHAAVLGLLTGVLAFGSIFGFRADALSIAHFSLADVPFGREPLLGLAGVAATTIGAAVGGLLGRRFDAGTPGLQSACALGLGVTSVVAGFSLVGNSVYHMLRDEFSRGYGAEVDAIVAKLGPADPWLDFPVYAPDYPLVYAALLILTNGALCVVAGFLASVVAPSHPVRHAGVVGMLAFVVMLPLTFDPLSYDFGAWPLGSNAFIVALCAFAVLAAIFGGSLGDRCTGRGTRSDQATEREVRC